MQQATLKFTEQLPRKPYCTNKLGAMKVRSKVHALQHRYLQHNQPKLVAFMVFDVDYDQATFAWDDAGLPPPLWVATNPKNGHAHLCYALSAPVSRSNLSRLEPLRYLAAIEAALCDRLGADIGYSGLICKNPLHPHWKTIWYDVEPYDLSYLEEFCGDISHYTDRRRKWTEYGLGRNVTLFENVREWAYKAVRDFWYPNGEEHWCDAVLARCETINGQFKSPLDIHESDAVSKSVAKWVWRHFTPEKFRAIQAARGVKGGKAKGEAYADKRSQARDMAAQGLSCRAIAKKLGCSPQSVSNWVSK